MAAATFPLLTYIEHALALIGLKMRKGLPQKIKVQEMAKTLPLNELRRRCSNIVIKWKDEPGDECQQAQTFVHDLFKAFGMTDSQIGTRTFEG